MDYKTDRVLVTGGFGFIGSNMVRYLNAQGIRPYVYDTFAKNSDELWRNVAGLDFLLIPTEERLFQIASKFGVIIHLGANVVTTESMNADLWNNNIDFTTKLRSEMLRYDAKQKFIYASSAAVYGAEETNFKERTDGLRPLNAYAFTKLMVDRYFSENPDRTYGLRFFNVYGPNEAHKGDMASVIHKALTGQRPLSGTTPLGHKRWVLFKSHREGIEDGEQKRDFVYVGDVCDVIWYFMNNDCSAGIYNLGSGKAESFNKVVATIDPYLEIKYRDMPEEMRNQYQYFTQADLTKLRDVAGYKKPFTSLAEGINKTKEAMGLK